MGGGGVIPVAMHNGDLYFLFGQENDVIRDASKNQDWGDFGGSAKPGETARRRPDSSLPPSPHPRPALPHPNKG